MFERYNKLVEDWHNLHSKMLIELKDCGFVDVLEECKASGDFSKANELLEQMADSPCKAYIKRKRKLDKQ